MDSNHQPSHPECDVLPVELRRNNGANVILIRPSISGVPKKLKCSFNLSAFLFLQDSGEKYHVVDVILDSIVHRLVLKGKFSLVNKCPDPLDFVKDSDQQSLGHRHPDEF